MAFRSFHLLIFRVRVNLLHDFLNLLQFEVDNVVHNPLGKSDMFLEQVEVEIRFGSERIDHIRIQVDSKQAARIVRTQRNLATRIRRHRTETQISVTIRYRLTDNRIPEQHTRFRRLPCIVHNLLPQCRSIDFLLHLRVFRVNRELLCIRTVLHSCPHEVIIYLHRHIGSRHLSFRHLGINECLRIGMFDRNRHH